MNSYKNLIDYIYSNNTVYENTNLLLNKLIKKENIENKKNNKHLLIELIKLINYNNFLFIEYIESITEDLKKQNFVPIYNNFLITQSSLICGLGSTHVLETSLTLHHIWGVPYIPASSLKGVCREVAFWKLVESRNIQEGELQNFQTKFYANLIDDEDILFYQLIFGAQDFKGLLLFLDVYPDFSDINSKKPFKLDIMNPHYSSYYSDDSGKTVPGDWENPVPIYFLTVKPGVKFKFVVMFDNYRWEKIKVNGIQIIENNKKKKIDVSESLKDKILKILENNSFFEEILKETLSTYGVGTKTRLGYGSFKV